MAERVLPDRPPGPSVDLALDVAGIGASLRVIASAPLADPSDPEIGYYAAELRSLRAAMLPGLRGDLGL